MARLCSRHPQIGLTFELQNFAALDTSYWGHLRRLRKNWYVRGMLRNAHRHSPWPARFGSAVFLARYSLGLLPHAGQPIGVAQIEGVLRGLFPGAALVGDKYPRYVFQLDRLVMEPAMRRVIIFRDGRDVVQSVLAKVRGSWRNTRLAHEFDTVEKIAAMWVRSIEAMEKHRQHLYCIRYEDLARQPHVELEALAAWLGLRPDGFQSRLVHDASVGKYRAGLTPDELTRVMDVAGPTLARLGYL
jgi:hypothetical protein